MVGRTPEYLGKKIEAREVKLSVIAFLVMPLGVLGFAALSAVLPVSLASLQDAGPHGLSEILYAYSSATGNNGSAFAGFAANMPSSEERREGNGGASHGISRRSPYHSKT